MHLLSFCEIKFLYMVSEKNKKPKIKKQLNWPQQSTHTAGKLVQTGVIGEYLQQLLILVLSQGTSLFK